MYAVVIPLVALVALVTERGASPTAAAWVLGLCGAGQTLGRTLYATLARHTGVTTRTVTLIVAGGATTAALVLTPGPYPLLLLLAIAAGMVRGNLTLLQATAVTGRWGPFASAIAHFAGAALAGEPEGYPALFGPLAGISVGARLRPRRPSDADGMGAGRDQARGSRCRSTSSALCSREGE
ncbi:hypothetical protein [Streptomyces sp. TRM68416]|uniref:hypothetical protein n=1 Tax=Streptomyces sp. TRM68416 TaxID=2758412 RepID=UPI00166213EA|nr:hypothetical protein [Streptomyces sp. TRM68416]MBD0844408.1 hypothetical protein [Streptomyces sp. TRM68416]